MRSVVPLERSSRAGRRSTPPGVWAIVAFACCLTIGAFQGSQQACASTIYAVGASGEPGAVVEVPIQFDLLGTETGINKIQILANVTPDGGATALATNLGVNGVYATRCGNFQLQPPPNNTPPTLAPSTTTFDWNWASSTSRFVAVNGPQTGYEACRMLVTLPGDAVPGTTYNVHLVPYDSNPASPGYQTGTTVKKSGTGPIPAAGSSLGGDIKITVLTPHTFSVSASATPGTVASGGSTDLSATPSDSLGHGVASWTWDDGGAGGDFSPSANVQNPAYTAPENLTDDDVVITLTVNATCDGGEPLSDSDTATLTVNPVTHTLSASASADPSTVASGGTTSLTGSAADSRSGHSIATWAWDDSEAGGSFSPSASVQNPSYTTAANSTDSDRTVTLTLTATCDGASPLSDSDATELTVNPVAHTFSVTADAPNPGTVNSGGTTSLSATFSDSRSGHSVAAWTWSDGGAGGGFSPSEHAQNPSYTAPANTSDDPVTVTLTVSATCDGPVPSSDSDSATLTVNPADHTLDVDASASPSSVASGGTTSLTASAVDSRGHGIITWAWGDGGAGGSFSPSASVQNPSYTAAANATDSDRAVTLTVTATCDGPSPISNSDTIALTVRPAAGAGEVSGTTLPPELTWDQQADVTITYHNAGTLTWDPLEDYQLLPADGIDRWNAGALPLPGVVGPGEDAAFAFSITAPPVTTLTYMSDGTPSAPPAGALDCDWQLARGTDAVSGGPASTTVTISRFPDTQSGTPGAWARFYVEECAGRVPQIVGGYPDGSYGPSLEVTRDQMAVFMQRAMQLPLGTYAGEFSDVVSPFWAESQIQACVDNGIVGGYSDGTYRPSVVVNRDTMAVFVARGMAGGESEVPPGPGAATFPDVPTGYWAFRHIEYAVANHVVGGYPDGTYRPTIPVTRDQMAVFVYRAAIQPTGAVVTLGGPALTAVDPEAGGTCGWASAASAPVATPGYAYVALDAARFGGNLTGLDSLFDVYFELRDATTPTRPATGDYQHTESRSLSDLLSARADALSSGDPHYVASWALPTTLLPGDYLLVVSTEDAIGGMCEIARKPAFTINP